LLRPVYGLCIFCLLKGKFDPSARQHPTNHDTLVKHHLIVLTAVAAALLAGMPLISSAKDPAHAETAPTVPPAEALGKLKAGNARFVAGDTKHPHQSTLRRTELATGQHPFAIVLGCADSRTSPEVLFDQGLGDLFVIRVAGNVVNDETEGSIEYAVEHLGARLIVVLGHERCGAVKAAKETLASKGKAPGHIQSLVKAIRPAVKATAGGDVEATCKMNIHNVAQTLSNLDPILKDMAVSGKVAVVGAHYDLDTGAVEFLK